MPTPTVNYVTYWIHLDGQRTQLFFIKSDDCKDGSSGTAHTSSTGRVIDVTRKNGEYQLDLKSCRAADSGPEVDWRNLKRTNQYFRFEIREVRGSARIFEGCRVMSVNRSNSDSNEVAEDISIMARDDEEIL